MAHELKPRWAEMCARILQQCEVVLGSREQLAARLGASPADLRTWLSGRSGPPTEVFDKAMDVILAEHDRRIRVEESGSAPPRRRAGDASRTSP
jgi:hypothetical protein